MNNFNQDNMRLTSSQDTKDTNGGVFSPHLQHRSHSENNMAKPDKQTTIFRRTQLTAHDSDDYNSQQNDREIRLQRAYESLDHIDRQISGLRNSHAVNDQQMSSVNISHATQHAHHQQQQQPQFRGTVIFKNQQLSQRQPLPPQQPVQPVHYVQHAYPPQYQMRSLPPSPPSSMQQYPPSQPLNRTLSDGYPPARMVSYHHVSPDYHQQSVTNILASQPQYQYHQHPQHPQHQQHQQHQMISQHTFPGTIAKSAGHQQTTQSRPQGLSFVYMVHFKRRVSEHLVVPSQAHHVFSVSDFVIVNSEPFGEDLGVVVEVLTAGEYERNRRNTSRPPLDRRLGGSGGQSPVGVGVEDIGGRILRMASVAERQRLPLKRADEEQAVEYCQHLITDVIRMTDMTVFDAEFTIDRRKLTFYYHSESHVDFRELVKDMYARYKTRIWMKKMSQEPVFRPQEVAVVQLITGAVLSVSNNKNSSR